MQSSLTAIQAHWEMVAKVVSSPIPRLLHKYGGLCYHCRKALEPREPVISNGGCGKTKYYHPACARKINLWLGVLPPNNGN